MSNEEVKKRGDVSLTGNGSTEVKHARSLCSRMSGGVCSPRSTVFAGFLRKLNVAAAAPFRHRSLTYHCSYRLSMYNHQYFKQLS